MTAVERLRSEPYRLFFPLGVLLSWAGVGHWLLFGWGATQEYRSIFHAITQVQGFLMCFAAGFLTTMLPRRTSSPPPSLALIALCLLCPIATSVAAWRGAWILAQLCWLVLAVALLAFAAPRLGPALGTRRPPHSFVWIPAALALGILGTLATAVGAALGPAAWSLHELGRGLVLQAMFVALVLGVGSFAIPLLTRGEAAADAGQTPRDDLLRTLHLLGIGALAASFVVEAWGSVRLGLGLRGAVAWAVLLLAARLYRPPARPGLIRWSIWSAAWCVPLGYTVAALSPLAVAGPLHITFIGGFALLALSVGAQVILGHGGYGRLKAGRPPALLAMIAALLLAIAARLMMVVREDQLLLWTAWAAGLFLVATATWSAFLIPKLFRQPRELER
ncbi:MAG TPA: NnrS family protein [Thermoanaerobaculia bacterium]|nr:NnrS family protein [Thermoanaerobaculia bacterium]